MMTKKIINNVLAIVIFLVVLFFTNSNDKAFSDIVTFVSISTGFCVTALSIIATSDFSKKLYQKEVQGDNSQTLLHQLVHNFKSSIFIFTTTVILILIYKLIDIETYNVRIDNHNLNLIKIVATLIWYFTCVSIIKFVKLVKLFAHFVIKSAR